MHEEEQENLGAIVKGIRKDGDTHKHPPHTAESTTAL